MKIINRDPLPEKDGIPWIYRAPGSQRARPRRADRSPSLRGYRKHEGQRL